MHATKRQSLESDHPRCGGGADVHLPLLADSRGPAPPIIRPSRMSRRRAVVLGAVQLAMILHIVQWLVTGSTTTPIEPSESMEFVKRGVINAGVIFFALALLSTLLLGRWFCGWGCHLVMLQDLCGWMMKKIGVRPKPFRSRLLLYVPLGLALYMFIWPAAHRLIVAPVSGTSGNLPDWRLEAHLTTTDFWHTFAGVAVAIPFLLVCGFATVYFLGAKGFCTYGCPYGGFFAPLDRLARGRIRVTDACEHCGHCTAVCSSNVRVHEEVRDYGMVVDPGCMKCMDCVSVCPNDALYFGFGPIALGARPRVERPAPRRLDLTLGEEIACALLFLGAFFAFRGLYGGLIPMLFAVGIAGCTTFVLWKAWCVLGDRDCRFHRFQLRRGGGITRWGAAWLASCALLLALTLHSMLVQYHAWRGGSLADDASRAGATPEAQQAAGRALGHLLKADSWSEGGLGLLGSAPVALTRARLHLLRGEWAECERLLRRGIDLGGPSDRLVSDLGRVMLMTRPVEDVIEHYRSALDADPQYNLTRAALAALLDETGRGDEAQRVRAAQPRR